MNKNSAKYSQDMKFSQVSRASNTEFKNLYNATPDLVISQSSSSRIHT